MKRLVTVAALCALFSAAAFALLVAADRQLGLPLPYSMVLSFTVVSIVAPLVYAIANAVRRRRRVTVTVTSVPTQSAPQLQKAVVRRHAEGVVLLDLRGANTLRERAA